MINMILLNKKELEPDLHQVNLQKPITPIIILPLGLEQPLLYQKAHNLQLRIIIMKYFIFPLLKL